MQRLQIQKNAYFSLRLRFVRAILMIGVGLLSFVTQAMEFSHLKPYVGLDYIHRNLAFKEGYGKGNFNKRLPQGSFFLGLQVNEYLGLEAGYLLSQASSRTSYTDSGQLMGGITINPNQFVVFENKVNLIGPQVNIIGSVPFGESRFSGIGLFGVSWLTLKMRAKPLANERGPFPPAIVERGTRTFNSKKLVPRIMMGIGYQLSDYTKIRILSGYELTSQFKNIVSKKQGPLVITLKNNILCSVGIVTHF